LIGTAILKRRQARRHRGQFNDWAQVWREYSLFLLNHIKKDTLVGDWTASQTAYEERRASLVELEDSWQRAAAAFALKQSEVVWGDNRSKLDARLGLGSFFGFYKDEQFDLLMVHMMVDSDEGLYSKRGHPMRTTITGTWDALSRYSVAQGWGPLDPLPPVDGNPDNEILLRT